MKTTWIHMGVRPAVSAVLALGLTIAAASPMMAQTTDPATTTAGDTPQLMTEKTAIRVRPLLLTEVPLNEPRAIDLGQLNVPGATTELTDGVTVKGYTRYVEFEGQRIAQIVLSSVEKNGAREPLPANTFATQFNLDEPRLDPAEDLVFEGDGAAMVAALERLSSAAPQEQQVAQETLVQSEDPRAQQQNTGSTGGNDQAASWAAPDPVTVSNEAGEEVRITTDGCFIRPDVEQMRAFQQSKTVTMKNGNVVSETDCADSNVSVPIKPSYSVCSYEEDVDPAVRTATAQFQLYYVDPLGNRVDVGECTPDPEKVTPIVEKSCGIFLDYQNLKAVPQAALVYQDLNNREVQVRGCAASETVAAVNMEPTTNGCTIRHEFTGTGTSFQQGTFTYVLDGVTYQAGGCIDNGTEYPHEKVYVDRGGVKLCEPVLDANGKPTALQSRVRIVVDGNDQYITPCTPDTSGSVTISPTTDTCDSPSTWEHDINAGQSYGMERYYFMDGGQRRWVTDCQKSQAVYTHNYDTTGWQPHDDQLFAYRLQTVWINPPTGRYDVSVSIVVPGSAQQPYQLAGTAENETGVAYYPADDCNKYKETAKVENWTRPDGSTFPKPIGPGTPIGPAYDCAGYGATLGTDWNKTGTSYSRTTGKCLRYRDGVCSRHETICTRIGTYSATRYLRRGDGVDIDSQTKSASMGCGSYTASNGAYYCNLTSGCPANPSDATAASFKNSVNFPW